MMSGAPTPVLRLALTLAVEQLPIAGTLQYDAGPDRFDGWLELIAALEALLKAAREDKPPIQPEDRR
jgi:hypothetical protein